MNKNNSYTSFTTTRAHRCMLGMSVLCIAAMVCVSSFAQDFEITQIADPNFYNHTPVISSNRTVAWQAFELSDQGENRSDIYTYRNKTLFSPTKESMRNNFANVLPIAVGSRVIWTTTHPAKESVDSWAFKMPPEGEIPMLPARYKMVTAPDEPGSYTGWFVGEGETNIVEQTNRVSTGIKRAAPSGNNEIIFWEGGSELKYLTNDNRNDVRPSASEEIVAWQKSAGWPFGWEIMISHNGTRKQLTTNVYYDMGPNVSGNEVVWYGWDGSDFEIFYYNAESNQTVQITNNTYDDLSPVVDKGLIAWEAFPAFDSEIFIWKNGDIEKISITTEDDTKPSTWNGQVVWQVSDETDMEIYLYDGEKSVKLTANEFDDMNPQIQDGVICWMAYKDNWDAEIFYWNGTEAVQLTDNDFEDYSPATGGGAIVWQTDEEDKSLIYLAEPVTAE